MKPRYKVTGCARFFLFLVIFVPIVFFGAAYIRGENGMQIIKDFYHNLTGKKETTITPRDDSRETYSVEELSKQLEAAQEEIRFLKEKVEVQEKEIARLKAKQ